MTKYAAFLRGINVGGHKPVPMQKLKKALESLHFKNVQTLLASGNVVFEAPPIDTIALEQKLEAKLQKTFGMKIGVLIRTMEELQSLNESQPFKGIDVTPETRLYVTFFSEKPKNRLKIPYTSPDKSYKILYISGREVCSVLILSSNSQTTDLMKVLEKEFGRKVTTRNWNTIVRVLAIKQ
ncbi:MAG: DUF1697 domain-containing protein [Ignavibacteriales bacterium]|nr:DUF1697 domain-containing protein [Ignavibacteriales bacterium]